ncbi:hypothetical protein ABZ719_36580 [Streptomyces sp. NPDC006743]|uniref:hypothetical protein n=1 Tax=Streptomyces sp. NPDC006743 TaxID=3154480 RepID=UPI003451323F
MTRTRTVRLPSHVPPSAVTVDGVQHRVQEDDGSTVVEFVGVLRVHGRPVLSPGQLLELWEGQAHLEYEVAEATLRPQDAMPVSDKARLGAYAVGADIARKVRALGHTDDKVPAVLEEMRAQFAAKGPAQGTTATAARRAAAQETDTVLQQMTAAWQQAITFEWISDT